MSRLTLRKAVAGGLGAALIASGLTVAMGAGVATAAPACAKSQSVSSKWAGSAFTEFTLSKLVHGDDQVAPGGEAVYRTKIVGSGAIITEMRDFPPAGFELVGARINYDGKWSVVNNKAQQGNDGSVVVKGPWDDSKKPVTLETTYKVPDNAKVGAKLDSGGGTNIALAAGDWNIKPMGVCVTVRMQNPGEMLQGGLETMGFGSFYVGSSTIAGSLGDS